LGGTVLVVSNASDVVQYIKEICFLRQCAAMPSISLYVGKGKVFSVVQANSDQSNDT
jgi:hypothetical protein